MNLAEIESMVHAAIDAGDEVTIEAYAEHCAERLEDIGVMLCLALIGIGGREFASVMAVAAQKTPDLADALEKLEDHIQRSRALFTEQRAQKLSDEIEDEEMRRAEMNKEFSR